ncbi:serine hydrolase [Lacticaseibacillus sp. N501-2]|uniref:serine hydrolase n=1 Tax=Lacticaseibacillus salsurae TaxID=3367729 RepID=UPI0038B3AA83
MKHVIVRTLALGLAFLAVISGAFGVQQVVSGRDRQITDAKASTSSVATSSSADTTTNAKRAAIQAKVQAYLTQVGSDHTVSVTFKNLTPQAGSAAAKNAVYNSGSLTAAVNGDTLETAASTYKLFIAAYLFSHGYDWTTTAQSGFDQMVVNSANDFSESVLAQYGDATIDRYLQSQGWNTVFSADQAAQTSSNTLASLLTQLQAGTGAFQTANLRNWLLTDMAQQVYRSGIPQAAGTGGTVQDKVGFLNDVNNDAAIVTLPNGARFILVIMTHGHDQATLDFSRINTIAEHVIKLAYGA